MAMGGKAGEQFTEINVTPLTDVFLVLLVIMILVAPLVNMSVLKVDPPGSSSNPEQKPDDKPTIKVDVGKDGVIKVNGNAVAVADTQHVAEAMSAVAKGDLDMPVVLTSDADALQKYVVAVMDAAAGLGLKKLSVAPLRK
jgi:biopolymer transport protein ExbD